MIIPDVNVLLNAYNASSARHSVLRRWWEDTLSGDRPVGLPWAVTLGFIRIATNPRAWLDPMPVADAIQHVRAWMAQPAVEIIGPGDRHADILFRLLESAGTAANLTSDAHLAALAIEYQAEIATTDLDFGRFTGLRWFNPARKATS
ncbi:MAG TPA: type II toxin-antitoxin system VapC family toxin [Bryobacteraceae bacterium]|nr:type II toxin-antitoxin system VapC family toxin [Bryobacteraceae bacterium]